VTASVPMQPAARRRWRALACALVVGLALAGAVTAGGAAAGRADDALPGVPERGERFRRLATLPAYRNATVDDVAAAEIAAATPDGRTLVYTDSPGERLGIVDLSRLDEPKPAGTVALPGEPTSVDVLGNLALTVVNTSASFTDPSGVLQVIDLSTRQVVAGLELGGQPDSIDIAPDGRYAAVAVENERDEDVGGGAIPQLPAGYLAVVDLAGEPSAWTVRRVQLTGLAQVAPEDPEPEFVSVNRRGQAVVSLQENNHLVVVDLRRGEVVAHFSAGQAVVAGVDTVEDGQIRQDGAVTAPREPDGVAWVGDHHVATADEGDLAGGSRTWTVFDARGGAVVFFSGAELERLAVRYGQYPEFRAQDRGVEPEGVAVATYGGARYAFVGTERANLVAVYRIDDPRHPELVQALPTGVGPEGLLPLPQRHALAVAAEEDAAEDNVRASVSIYRLTGRPLAAALRRNQAAPSIVSADDRDGNPIGFGALSGLSGVPGTRDRLVAVTDNAYTPARILGVDAAAAPAVVDSELPLTRQGGPVGYDAEGVAARAGGGYWLAAEGNPAAGLANLLVEVDRHGRVVREVGLPPAVAAGATANGFEGVAVLGGSRRGHAGEQVWVAVQRGWADNLPGQVTLARFTPATGEWAFAAYPLDAAPPGGFVGLSELTAAGEDTLLVLERDNQRGDGARVKKVYLVDVSGLRPVAAGEPKPVAGKRLAVELLPALRAGGVVVADKPEGLAISGRGRLLAAVDNDGLEDAPGESVLLRLGSAPR
jgi:DNA-binding beta-propeller fold protein YncE